MFVRIMLVARASPGRASPPMPPTAQPQQRYQVLERIAAGGMAEVFRAESAGLEGFKKTVAIKRVLPHLAQKGGFIGMFLDEARLSAHLSHSNCVQVFDIGRGEGTYFIVMEYVDGADLKALAEFRRARQQRFPIEEACFICVKVCEGLAYAHALVDTNGHPLGIVHRDMSPPNVLITRYGEVKIVDFGLAKANSQLERSEPGIIKGKFGYLSPEAATGREVDARTDIFALGIMLWELLAGRRLFQGDSDYETVQRVQAAEVPSLARLNPQVPEELEGIVRRALSRQPEARFQSAAELGRALNDFLFHFGRGVSSFDLAALIGSLLQSRDAERAARKNQALIGSLIHDTLFQFTSLQDEAQETSGGAEAGAAPLNLGAFEGLGGGYAARDRTGLAPSLAPGNLAALEDDGATTASDVEDRVPEFHSLRARAPESARPSRASTAPGPAAPDVPARRKQTLIVAAAVAISVAVVALGAYLAGLLGQ